MDVGPAATTGYQAMDARTSNARKAKMIIGGGILAIVIGVIVVAVVLGTKSSSPSPAPGPPGPPGPPGTPTPTHKGQTPSPKTPAPVKPGTPTPPPTQKPTKAPETPSPTMQPGPENLLGQHANTSAQFQLLKSKYNIDVGAVLCESNDTAKTSCPYAVDLPA